MIPVTLLDVFYDTNRGEYWLVLAEESEERGLGIFVGSWSPGMVLSLRRNTNNPRPLTFQFMANMLEAAGAVLEEVQITEVVDETYRAVACIQAGDRKARVDARPSDAVGLAVFIGRPIYVAESLMTQAGKPLGPDGRTPDVPESFISTQAAWKTG